MKFFGISIGGEDREVKSSSEHPFKLTMQIANKIALENPQALHDFVRALIRPLQSEHMLAVAERGDHEAPEPISGNSFFFTDMDLFSHSRHYLPNAAKHTLNLARDPILPTPWRRDGFVNALANIGSGKTCGKWEQESNHVVHLWLPWGIGFVTGGNHSIASGILSGEDISIDAKDIYDFSPILDIVECDGRFYKNKETGEVLARVTDYRRAAVFEIGRLIVHHQVKIAANGK